MPSPIPRKHGATIDPIRAHFSPRFGWTWLLSVLFALLLALPLITLLLITKFDAVSTFIEGLNQRKELSAAAHLKDASGHPQPRLMIVGGATACR